MNNWLPIESPDDAKKFVQSVDWHDAFVRELYLLSPSYVNTENGSISGIHSFGAAPSAKCLMCTSSQRSPAVEIYFQELETLEVYFATDLDIGITWRDRLLEWRFQRKRDPSVVCKKALYRHLDVTVLDDQQRYGWQPLS